MSLRRTGEITENPQDDQRGQISDSNGTENGGVLDARRAAIQALPFAGSINPSWVECTACKKIVRLQGNLYRSYRFELHSKSKTHLQAVENLNSGDHSTTSSGKVDDMASHKEPSQKPRTRNKKTVMGPSPNKGPVSQGKPWRLDRRTVRPIVEMA